MTNPEAIAILINSVERTFADDALPEDVAQAIRTLARVAFPDAGPRPPVESRNTHARGRKVEVLLFARHTRKWEFAKQEWNEAQLKWQWIRSRDGGSYICKVGEEIATMDAPPPPEY